MKNFKMSNVGIIVLGILVYLFVPFGSVIVQLVVLSWFLISIVEAMLQLVKKFKK